MPEPFAIDLTDLRKTYRDGLLGRNRVEALRGVTFRVPRGEIFGLLGPNGAGKTTLIKVLLGIVRKSGGEARLLGRPAGHIAGRRRVGYLPESHRIPRHLTGNSALEYYGGLSGLSGREIARRRPELLDRVGLAQWGKASVRKYSKGMLQRLGLAQALLHDPDLLILDEPTDGVDPGGRAEMRALLHELKAEGKTIFINSHLLQEIELVCDRVVILAKGEIRREGGVRELTTAQGAEIVFTLAGTEANARAALAERQTSAWQPAGPEMLQTHVLAADQSEIDACVDALRRRGVSIISMARRRQTLEDAFLAIMEESQPFGGPGQ